MIGFLQQVLSLIGAFCRWWFSELAALIPPQLRRLFRQGGEGLLLEIDDDATRLYRMRGNRAERLGPDAGHGRAGGKTQQVTLILAGKMLVTRETDPHDRRMVRVALTDEGARIAQRGARVYDRIHARALEGVAAKTLDRIDDGVRELLDALERRDEG